MDFNRPHKAKTLSDTILINIEIHVCDLHKPKFKND